MVTSCSCKSGFYLDNKYIRKKKKAQSEDGNICCYVDFKVVGTIFEMVLVGTIFEMVLVGTIVEMVFLRPHGVRMRPCQDELSLMCLQLGHWKTGELESIKSITLVKYYHVK